MIRPTCVAALAVAACSGSPRTGAADEPAPPSPAAAEHAHTFANLKARLGDVTAVAIVGESGEVIALDGRETAAIRAAIERCSPSSGFAATPPPWPVVFRASAGAGHEWFFQLAATALRMDSANPRAPSLASIHDESPTVADCALAEADDPLVWSILEAHLGPTREKAYKTAPIEL